MVTVGNLQYFPALEHGELLAEPVLAALTETAARTGAASRAHVGRIDPSLADTDAFLAAYETDPADSANCVVVLGRRGDERRPAACLVPSNLRADVNTTIRKLLDARKASFAPHDWAVDNTGMEYGGITAIGLPASWRLLIDHRVTQRDWVITGSGLRRSKIAIPGAELAALPGAEVIDGLAF